LTGGDPFHPANRDGIAALCAIVKTTHQEKDIWCWTGYLFEQIKDLPAMTYISTLVDGPYIAAKNPGIGKIKWRGSTNQRIIDVQKSLLYGETVSWIDPFE
jgi:anaerobic ribonucleoside-triphosphate reductase activating protein